MQETKFSEITAMENTFKEKGILLLCKMRYSLFLAIFCKIAAKRK